MNKEGASGPDGFTVKFFHSQWHIVKDDLCNAITQFFKGHKLSKAWKSTFISLIPKNSTPSTFKDFRPISLCNVAYKIISKILASRMDLILTKIISPEQGAFVKHRLIHDNIALTQEMTQNINTKVRGGNVILNLDMEKAFDRLQWPFLFKVLEKFGFSNVWIQHIKNCIIDIPFSIIIKGSSSPFFKSSRGLRQGDPISPGLFIIAEEVLSRGITALVFNNKVLPFYATKSIKGITHSLYADDIIIFTNGSSNSLNNLMNFLLDYQNSSGQKINYSKSNFIASKNLSPTGKSKISNITNFGEGSIPFLYLGCYIFHGRSRPIYFDNIIQRI
jgi:hypothetical protein